jgi:ribonuclease Z
MQHYNLHVRALTVPGPETDLSVFVAFDNVRYLFGCGEGTQRAFVQKRLRTPGLAGVFLPDGGSKGRAGLPGACRQHCGMELEVRAHDRDDHDSL